MRKYYNYETNFRSLKDELSVYLKQNEFTYEVSATGTFCGWHFEILCNPAEVEQINRFLDEHTITEVRA